MTGPSVIRVIFSADGWPRDSAEGECERLDTRIEEANFENMIGNRAALTHKLVKPLAHHEHPLHGSPGPGAIAEARRVLPQMQQLCRPPSVALIAAWCRKVALHLPRAPLDEQAVLLAVQGSLWPAATCPTRCGRGEGDAARYTCLRDGLARVIAAAERQTAQPRRPEDPTPEAVEHIAALVSAFVS